MHRWLARNVLFPLQEQIKGHPTTRILKEMEAADRLSARDLAQLQCNKLKDFVNYCYAHVPYVREQMKRIGFTPSDVRSPGDLRQFPLLTKDDVRKHRGRLRSEIAGKLAPFSSGGSTGEPLIFDLGKRRVASRVACRQRVSRWWGVSVGDRELALWGSPLELKRQDWIRIARDWILRTQLLSAYELNEPMMSKYVRILETGRFEQIFAYPSSIYLLCRYAQKNGKDLRKLGVKIVFVTSEVLFPYQRELITETLGCPVANGYGGRDSGFIAHECPQGGMHLMADAVIAETVDKQGHTVPLGESGEIVVTDLYSHEAPFLRYKTGDIGVISSRPCACGRPLPLLERLDGRSNDSIVTPDGRIMHGQSVISLLMEVEGIEQFRIVQNYLDRFHLQIVKNGRFRPESEDWIRKHWCERLRSTVHMTFEYLPQFPPERSGKFRHIISELPEEEGVRSAGGV